MRFAHTDEQAQFRAVLRRFLQARAPMAEVRRQMATHSGYDRAFWRELNDELGLAALHVPEDCGGQGFGFIELGIALEEMGRALVCAPFFASAVLATQAILNAATADQRRALLPRLVSGETIATLAWVEDDGRWDIDGIALAATPTGAGYRLNGMKTFVLDGHSADLLIVAARMRHGSGDGGVSLFLVEAGAEGLTRRRLETIDATRKQAELRFSNVPAQLLGEPGTAAGALARTFDQAAIALACEMVGGAQALLDSAVAYAGMRMQFGRPIGSFQAIKHKCADLLLEIELANSAARYAAAAVVDNDPQVPALASAAKACASEAYMRAAAECIQIHGGIGFTWDHDTQLWYKRAKSSEVMLGDPCWHRERYLTHVEAAG